MSQGSAQTKAAAISAVAVVIAAVIGLVGTIIARDDSESSDRPQEAEFDAGDPDGSNMEVDVEDGGSAAELPEPGEFFEQFQEDFEQARGPASVFVNRDSGPGGTDVQLSGEGFESNERVVFRFHTTQIGSTTANSQGSFANVTVTIPTDHSMFAPQQFDIVATGESSIKSARTPFTLTG